MGIDLKKIYNEGFAKPATALNGIANQVIGKKVFGEVRTIDSPKVFPPFDKYPKYTEPEPEAWNPKTGQSRTFPLYGKSIYVSQELDTIMSYRPLFKECAEFYTEEFKFNYKNCVRDFDTLLFYFSDIYLTGLIKMATRAHSLLLPFGLFTVNVEGFIEQHTKNYKRAIDSYQTMSGIEESKNASANDLGNTVGNSVRMQGGGFGFKGAMKGMAQAGAFNLGMNLLGKYVANQCRMTDEEKARVFAAFKEDVFFQEVYSDYYNTFYTLVQTLADNKIIRNVTIMINDNYKSILANLRSPMFPQDKFSEAVCQLISYNPFVGEAYELIKGKYGHSDEVRNIIGYFVD